MENFMTRRNTFAMFVASKMSEDRRRRPGRLRDGRNRSSRRMEGLLRIPIGLSLVRVQLPPCGGIAQLVEQHVPFRTHFLDDPLKANRW